MHCFFSIFINHQTLEKYYLVIKIKMNSSGRKTKGMLFVFFSSIFHQNCPPERLRKIEEIQCHESWLVLLYFQDKKRKENPKLFCWSTGNSHSLARSSPNIVAFVRDFLKNQSLLAAEVGGAIICPYPLPQVLGEYLQLQRRRVEALFSYSFILEIFCNSSSFLVQLLTE